MITIVQAGTRYSLEEYIRLIAPLDTQQCTPTSDDPATVRARMRRRERAATDPEFRRKRNEYARDRARWIKENDPEKYAQIRAKENTYKRKSSPKNRRKRPHA
jgi:hypothetical protein